MAQPLSSCGGLNPAAANSAEPASEEDESWGNFNGDGTRRAVAIPPPPSVQLHYDLERQLRSMPARPPPPPPKRRGRPPKDLAKGPPHPPPQLKATATEPKLPSHQLGARPKGKPSALARQLWNLQQAAAKAGVLPPTTSVEVEETGTKRRKAGVTAPQIQQVLHVKGGTLGHAPPASSSSYPRPGEPYIIHGHGWEQHNATNFRGAAESILYPMDQPDSDDDAQEDVSE
jgi:hypothetical protein